MPVCAVTRRFLLMHCSIEGVGGVYRGEACSTCLVVRNAILLRVQ